MSSPNRPGRRKRRTREHVIADLSVNHVERQVLLGGYTVERVIHDYGIDLRMASYNDGGEIEGGTVALQLKATDSLPVSADGSAVAFPVSTADLTLWLAELSPVILVVYDAARDRAFWLYIQRYAEEQHLAPDGLGATVTVRIPVANVMDPAAVRGFRAFKARVAGQAWGAVRHSGP